MFGVVAPLVPKAASSEPGQATPFGSEKEGLSGAYMLSKGVVAGGPRRRPQVSGMGRRLDQAVPSPRSSSSSCTLYGRGARAGTWRAASV